MSERDHEQHAKECDCELVLDDHFASATTLEVHITEAIDEYMRLSIGCTDEIIEQALSSAYRNIVRKGEPNEHHN